MFTDNTQAFEAEHNYRGRALRDQTNRASRTTKRAAVLVAAALVLAACGIDPDANTSSNTRSVVAAVSDPGPSWAAVNRGPEVAGISVNSLGVFSGPTFGPNATKLAQYLDHGVFSAPRWDVSQQAIDEALGINRDAGIPGDSEPQGHPNYGRQETYLGTGGEQAGPR